jgi:hypothetical protein
MTQRHPVDHPSAWTPGSLGGKAGIAVALEPRHLDAIDEVLASTRDVGLHEGTLAQWQHPVLTPFLEEIHHIIDDGLGLVLVKGVTPERYGEKEMERIYWGFNTHFGAAVPQSQFGDLMGYVESVEGDKHSRGYRSAEELRFHCDTNEGVGLMCIRRAAEGGESLMASTMHIHNEILRTRPDLLEVLYEGFYLASGELAYSSRPVTPVKVPVFCEVDGVVSCMFAGSLIDRAAKTRGLPLTPIEKEAVDLFKSLAMSPDVHVKFLLEPGEMMLWQNFTNVHSRTRFANSDQHKRLLLRIWTKPYHPRPVLPAMHARRDAYEFVYRERREQEAAKAGAAE